MIAVKERGIIFSGPMVRAILDGRKTQTRRLVKWPSWANPEERGLDLRLRTGLAFYKDGRPAKKLTCPYGYAGDRLWVREGWRPHGDAPLSECADSSDIHFLSTADEADRAIFKWRPGIFLPRWASRISLGVEEVRAEQLQDITEAGALAEGVEYREELQDFAVPGFASGNSARAAFAAGWELINGKRAPWDYNPWVWVVTFKRIEVRS